MKSLLLLVFFSFFISFLHSQAWKVYVPEFGDTIGVADIDVIDENTVWVIGLRYQVNDSLYSFFGESKTWLARTIDHGLTWEVDTIPMGPKPFLANLAAIDANIAYVSGLNDFGNSKVLKTIDGGKHWKLQPIPWDAVASWADVTYAISPAKAVTMGDPRDGEFEIYFTGNGGDTWTKVPGTSIDDPLPSEFGFNNCGDQIGNTLWFGTNSSRIFRSENGGLTWTAYSTPTGGGCPTFSDVDHGLTAYVEGFTLNPITHLYTTSDGGETWSELQLADNNFRINGLEYIPGTPNIIMSLNRGNILHGPFETWLSKDRGQTWMQIDTLYNVGWINFKDSSTGWAGEPQQLEHKNRVYEYTGMPLTGLFGEAPLSADVQVRPNPASDFVELQLSSSEVSTYQVFIHDQQGQMLYSERVNQADSFSADYDISRYPAGTYRITVSDKNGSVTKAFIKN